MNGYISNPGSHYLEFQNTQITRSKKSGNRDTEAYKQPIDT
jgi:hypothetical protein